MCQPPPAEAVKAMLGPALPAGATIETVRAVSSARPQRLYEVVLSSGQALHLALPPLSMWRPLRSEQGMLESEAATVRWVSDVLTKQRDDASSGQKTQPSSSSQTKPDPAITANSVLALLPTLLHHGQGAHLPNSSYAVYKPVRGRPLSLLSPTPSSAARRNTDRELGALFRNLAALTSPTGRFGPLAAVAGPPISRPAHHQHHHSSAEKTAAGAAAGEAAALPPKVLVEGGLSATGGAGTWSVAFHSMLEGVLRDGEDMAVVMSYATIRRHVRRLGYLLDEVTAARLVLVDGAEAGNVLVVVGEEDEPGDSKEIGEGDTERAVEWVSGAEGEKEKHEREEATADGQPAVEVPPSETESQQSHKHPGPRVTGLRDWSSAIFGDPLLATVFSDPHLQPPSAAFLEGFNGGETDANADREPNARNLPFPLNKTIIEDVGTAWVRILLYQAYHAVARVVSEFYRPRQDTSARELEARRKLNEVLARLAEVPDDVKRRHRRPDGEMSPAKRFRSMKDE